MIVTATCACPCVGAGVGVDAGGVQSFLVDAVSDDALLFADVSMQSGAFASVGTDIADGVDFSGSVCICV